ncbi:hypothetical protein B0O80DRAFT_501505 [Mortierella sp. GBAus27b]|nr:hypothetical protein BGX31_000562 [Mortierella sp. GBA43]KAI8349080.1 hypothetical protein B0O80DRAFT_501505 [Mortierella sp. GBAus27b]
MADDSDEQSVQAFRNRSTGNTVNIPTLVDPATEKRIILWRDIQFGIKNAESIWNGSSLVLFLTDDNFEQIKPLRIVHHPGVVLDVTIEGHITPSAAAATLGSTEATASVRQSQGYERSVHSKSSTECNNESQDTLTTNTEDSEQTLVMYSKTTDVQSTLNTYGRLYNAFLHAIMSGQETQAASIKQSMGDHFDQLQLELAKNKDLQEQLVQMQQQMSIGQQHMQQLQQQTNKELLKQQDEMLRLQHQALDRLAIVQNRVQTLITQTYELHEYPIPRLFIVLPKSLGLTGKLKSIFMDQFRLYFLCECGSHTMPEDSKTPHEIHLAKHEGYDLDKPTAFFEKYGSYVLTLMYMIKYGIVAAGLVVPPLANSKIVEGLDSTQKYVEYLRKNIVPLVDDTISFLQDYKSIGGKEIDPTADGSEFGRLEALEGADLRLLESYLKVKDQGRVLGNLYRVVTPEGHVKWVCFDHYKASYKESSIKQLRDIVAISRGKYIEEIGRVEIKIESSILAKQFYEAMIKARWIQELEITLEWDATMDDLREFAKAVTKANVMRLTMDGVYFKSPTLDVINRGRRYDPILKLASNARIQSLQIKGFEDFFSRVSKSSLAPAPKLKEFTVYPGAPLQDKILKSLNSFLEHCPAVTSLELILHRQDSITKTTSGVMHMLPSLEFLKIDRGNLSATAKVMKGHIQDVILLADELDMLHRDDIQFFRDHDFSRAAVMYGFRRKVSDRLSSELLHNVQVYYRLQIKHQGGRSLDMVATAEWKLQELAEIVLSNDPSTIESVSMECPRLSFTAKVLQGEIQDMVVTIGQLSDLHSSDLLLLQHGYLAQLVIHSIPGVVEEDQLAQILHHNPDLIDLRIKHDGRPQPSDSIQPRMMVHDVMKVAVADSSRQLRSLSIDDGRLTVTADISQGTYKNIFLGIGNLGSLNSNDTTLLHQGQLVQLTIEETPHEEDALQLFGIFRHNPRLARLRIQRKERAYPYWDNEDSSLLGFSDIANTLMQESQGECEAIIIEYGQLVIKASTSQGEVTDTVLTIRYLWDLSFNELLSLRHIPLNQLIVGSIPRQEDQFNLTDILRHNPGLARIQIEKYEDDYSGSEMKLQDLVRAISSSVLGKLDWVIVNYGRFSITTKSLESKGSDWTMDFQRLKDLVKEDLEFIRSGPYKRLALRYPHESSVHKLATFLNKHGVSFIQFEYQKSHHTTVAGGHFAALQHLSEMTTPETFGSNMASDPDTGGKLSLPMSKLQGRIVSMAIILKSFDVIPLGHLAFIQEGHLTWLAVDDTPLKSDKDRLAQILSHNPGLTHLQIGRINESTSDFATEFKLKLHDIVRMTISNNLLELESLRFDSGGLSMSADVSRGSIKSSSLTIDQFGSLDANDDMFLEHGHLTRLEVKRLPEEADFDLLRSVLDHNTKLSELRIGCEGRQFFDLFNYVMKMKTRQNLSTVQFMDENLTPFDLSADHDSKTHIQCDISFPDYFAPTKTSPSTMRTWIRIGKGMSIRNGDSLKNFIRVYGWSIVVLDEHYAQGPFASGFEGINLQHEWTPQLESLRIHVNSSGTQGVGRLDTIIQQSPNFKDLGLYVDLSNSKQHTMAWEMISRYGTKISTLKLYTNGDIQEGTSDHWLKFMTSFTRKDSFPNLQSLELSPDTEDSLSSASVPWITDMIATPLQEDVVVSQILQVEAEVNAKKMKKIALHVVRFESEHWKKLIEAIDFLALEHLSVWWTNFSQEQLKLLIDRISNSKMDEVPLKTLNIGFTDLVEKTDPETLKEMVAELKKKAPSIAILRA